MGREREPGQVDRPRLPKSERGTRSAPASPVLQPHSTGLQAVWTRTLAEVLLITTRLATTQTRHPLTGAAQWDTTRPLPRTRGLTWSEGRGLT